MASIGLDLGSVYTKAVLLDDHGRIELTLYRKKSSGDAAAVGAFFDEIETLYPTRSFHAGITGSRAAGPLVATNALFSIASGVRLLHAGARSIIEIGGHTSKFIVLGESSGRVDVRDFATNEACAAGTGSFLEQQAKRLGLSVEELAGLSAAAKGGATIAGRCSVFAKSDMIHLQQKGTAPEEIAYGLCLAICRNVLATLLKGRDVAHPVVLAGGCAYNAGIVRAFRELFGEDGVAVSPRPGLEGAVGAAAASCDAGAVPADVGTIRRHVAELIAGTRPPAQSLAPLARPEHAERQPEPTGVQASPFDAFLGVDVGSVSTDLVLLDRAGEIASSVYLPTRGRPVDVLLEGFRVLRSRFPAGLRIAGCGATGSGRYLAARLLGADVVKNEITCQMLGARRFVPGVDTILEIGGQDSKFISLRGGAISDFAMNKICAAGTGSFLEEQAREMGIQIEKDFAARALQSAAPLELGTRCTVFMETEVVNALRCGASVDDVCAGLAYSIVRNYLDKVVGRRPLGKTIIFQGGVASNDAVVAAFERVLGRPVHVHPFNRISGAIGAALAAIDAAKPATASQFRVPEQPPSLRSFECGLCANRCEVNVVDVDGQRAFFGDTCERYTARARTKPAGGVPPNLAEEYVEACQALFGDKAGSGLRIGIPRASILFASLPFWAAFFKALGHTPWLSSPSGDDTLSLAHKHLAVGVCLPIKLTAGHVQSLVASGVDAVFVPSVIQLPGDDPSHSYACPYAMAVPFILSGRKETRFLAPVISMESEEAFVTGFDPHRALLGVTRGQLREAWRAAVRAQEDFDAVFRLRARELMEEGSYRQVFAVLGKPYNTLDTYLNLSLFERLRRLGVLAIPQRMLPLEMPHETSELPWRFSADMNVAAMAVAATPDMVPVVVSNFGCGPDAFTFKRIEESLGSKPHLILEFDEHRGEAGLITRLEAFLDQLETNCPAQTVVRRSRQVVHAPVPAAGERVWIPYFADHAHAFCGLLRLNGCDARVLPPPAAEIRGLGEQHSLGRECHAYSMLAGDLLEISRRANGERGVFFFPGTALPCLLHEYGPAMRMLLSGLGISNVRVCSPTGTELANAFSVDALERFYLGLLSIELLVKGVCQVRPYETNRGMTDAMHRQNLQDIEDAIAGGDVLQALDAALRRLAAVPALPGGTRPIVGMAGDIYTKSNRIANIDLFRWLEEQGLEVWPSPFQIDLLDFGISRRLSESVARLDMAGLLRHGAVAANREVQQWRVRRIVSGRIARADEPGYLEMKKLTAPYMFNDSHELLFINVAKIVDFARNGADGIVNAICFNCMVGNASAAITEKIRRDYDEIPIITAVYSGGEDPSRRMVLEAFVRQVTAHRDRTHPEFAQV